MCDQALHTAAGDGVRGESSSPPSQPLVVVVVVVCAAGNSRWALTVSGGTAVWLQKLRNSPGPLCFCPLTGLSVSVVL